MRWLGILVVAFVLGTTAGAEPPFLDTFTKLYNPPAGSALAKAACVTCHVEPPIRNVYGKAVETELGKQQVRRVTDAVLKAIESADADADGWSNGDEIKQGFLPGDSNSHPAGTAPSAPSAGSATGSLIPDHRFHPLIVHFPIALFLFGVFVDVVGAKRKDKGLRGFALWNLGFAALASYGAVATGLWAFLSKDLPFSGLPLYHLILGVSACFFMTASAVLKRKNSEARGAYWICAGLATLCIMVGGHIGSVLVYG